MGLFVLASIGLSMYIWSMTLYNVYKPLSSTLSAATPSPFSFFNTLFTTTKEEPPKRQGRKRKNLTLAEAQREQLRESLKVLFIWLTCKGTEPVFDYTFGYIVPFYNPIKVLVLLIFARFRSQLSIHLFDSFIIPLGRPNTPLINSTAFTTLILPWLRFMLSLPFAHLFAAFRNTLNSLLASWGNDDQLETPQEDRLNVQRKMLEADRVPPPEVNPGIRHATTSSLRKGSGPSDGMGGSSGGNSLRYQRSMDSLSSRAGAISNKNKVLSSRQRSISSRMTPGTQETFQQLQSLPSVPDHLPEHSIRVEGRIVSGPAAVVASSPMKTFAHIPGAVDIVPPPDTRTVSHLRPSMVERMPGSLASSPVKAIGHGTIIETVADDHTITAANLVPFDEKTLSAEAQQEKQSSSDAEATLKADTNTPSTKKATSKRKVGEIDGELSEGREAKLKASPGKKTTRGRDITTTTSASKTAKTATKKNSDATTTSIPRSRSKRAIAEEPKVSSKIPRTRRGAT